MGYGYSIWNFSFLELYIFLTHSLICYHITSVYNIYVVIFFYKNRFSQFLFINALNAKIQQNELFLRIIKWILIILLLYLNLYYLRPKSFDSHLSYGFAFEKKSYKNNN